MELSHFTLHQDKGWGCLMDRIARMARIRSRWLIALIVTPVLLAVIAVTVLSYRQALASGATITLSPTSGAPGVTVQPTFRSG